MAWQRFVPDTHNKVLYPHIETFFERQQRQLREAEIDWLSDKDIKPVEMYNQEDE